MNASDPVDGRPTISNFVQDLNKFIHRRRRCREQERSRSTTRMKIADGPKCFRGRFHRVAANCTVHVKIDKAGCEIISAKINSVFSARACLLPNCGNFSFFRDNFEAIANSIGKNQTRVCENHAVNVERSTRLRKATAWQAPDVQQL